MEQLKDELTKSYVHPADGTYPEFKHLPTKQKEQLTKIFNETNEQTLARFTQLLVREWVFRVRLGAREHACYNAHLDKNNLWSKEPLED